MKSTNPDQAQIVIDKLEPVLPLVHLAIDEATAKAREFFEIRELAPDSYLFPHLVRYEAGSLLKQPQFRDAGYEFIELSNNGLSIIYKCSGCYYRIRVRKANELGELPTQGLSSKLKAHYRNEQPFLPSFDQTLHEYVNPDYLNLVIVWDVDQYHILTDVFLVCPKNENGEVHFSEAIQHSAMAVVGNAEFDGEANEIEDVYIPTIKKQRKP
jgi:hypothetical protein